MGDEFPGIQDPGNPGSRGSGGGRESGITGIGGYGNPGTRPPALFFLNLFSLIKRIQLGVVKKGAKPFLTPLVAIVDRCVKNAESTALLLVLMAVFMLSWALARPAR